MTSLPGLPGPEGILERVARDPTCPEHFGAGSVWNPRRFRRPAGNFPYSPVQLENKRKANQKQTKSNR
ncbi:MAG: hypothetical protein RIS70_1003 [Planctomycetota bacterium]|jgi:hypothetical protein